MESLGYIVKVKLLNAVDYGVPQYRYRLIFVGVKADLPYANQFEFPAPVYTEDEYRTLSDALSDLPSIKAGEKVDFYATEPNSEYQFLMRGINSEINKKKSVSLFNHDAPRHPQSTIDMIGQVQLNWQEE